MEKNVKLPVALDEEQMMMLKRMGYDTSKASMAYYSYGSGKTVLREASDDPQVKKKSTPAFTLEDVMALLPAVELPFGKFGLLYPCVIRFADNHYRCDYFSPNLKEGLFDVTGTSGLEAAMKMLLECHKRGYFGKVTVLDDGTKIYG
jgi:hypothetical protein